MWRLIQRMASLAARLPWAVMHRPGAARGGPATTQNKICLAREYRANDLVARKDAGSRHWVRQCLFSDEN
jgi:hypothetical protein